MAESSKARFSRNGEGLASLINLRHEGAKVMVTRTIPRLFIETLDIFVNSIHNDCEQTSRRLGTMSFYG